MYALLLKEYGFFKKKYRCLIIPFSNDLIHYYAMRFGYFGSMIGTRKECEDMAKKMARKRDVAVVKRTSSRTRVLNRARASAQGGIRL